MALEYYILCCSMKLMLYTMKAMRKKYVNEYKYLKKVCLVNVIIYNRFFNFYQYKRYCLSRHIWT